MRALEIATWRSLASAMLGMIRVGSLTIVEGGQRRTFGAGAPAATIELHDPSFWRMLMRGSRGLAESYIRGDWDSPDLVAVIRLAARNASVIDDVRRRTTPLWAPRQRLRAARNRNTRSAADATSPPTMTSATSCSSGCSIRR